LKRNALKLLPPVTRSRCAHSRALEAVAAVLRIDVAPQRRVTQARTCKAFPVEHLAPKLTCPTQVEDYDQISKLSSPLNCIGSGSGVSSAAAASHAEYRRSATSGLPQPWTFTSTPNGSCIRIILPGVFWMQPAFVTPEKIGQVIRVHSAPMIGNHLPLHRHRGKNSPFKSLAW